MVFLVVFFSKSNVKYMLCISVNYPKEATGEQDLRLEGKKVCKDTVETLNAGCESKLVYFCMCMGEWTRVSVFMNILRMTPSCVSSHFPCLPAGVTALISGCSAARPLWRIKLLTDSSFGIQSKPVAVWIYHEEFFHPDDVIRVISAQGWRLHISQGGREGFMTGTIKLD